MSFCKRKSKMFKTLTTAFLIFCLTRIGKWLLVTKNIQRKLTKETQKIRLLNFFLLSSVGCWRTKISIWIFAPKNFTTHAPERLCERTKESFMNNGYI